MAPCPAYARRYANGELLMKKAYSLRPPFVNLILRHLLMTSGFVHTTGYFYPTD